MDCVNIYRLLAMVHGRARWGAHAVSWSMLESCSEKHTENNSTTVTGRPGALPIDLRPLFQLRHGSWTALGLSRPPLGRILLLLYEISESAVDT